MGGDEFAVITRGHQAELTLALGRLDNAIEIANSLGGKRYRISFSAGKATTEPQSNELFADLVDRADAAMYEDKRQKRAARGAGNAPQQVAPADAASQCG